MKKTKLVWRLSNRPTPAEVAELLTQEIINKEEAREILFSEETDEDRDKKSLESEIKFLRELVDKLSEDRSQIITTIKEVQVPYIKYPWYPQYQIWCGGAGGTGTAYYSNTALNSNSSFSSINTF